MKKANRSDKHREEQIKAGKRSKWESKYKPPKGPEKGVHNKASGLSAEKHGGTSEAGAYVKGNKAKARDYDFNPEPRKAQLEEAKKEHYKVINEQKNIKAPNLPKSENMIGKSFSDMKKSEEALEKGIATKTALLAALAGGIAHTKGTLFEDHKTPVTRHIAGEPAHEKDHDDDDEEHISLSNGITHIRTKKPYSVTHKVVEKPTAASMKAKFKEIRNKIKGDEDGVM